MTVPGPIYVEKVQLPQPPPLIRLAAFKNPEFFNAQAMPNESMF